ncbi:alpha/beta fold hydrolase [Histidinibacterium aquaticum]|uniref:Alpha/beta fold hydrolase n=1 Tax=Histidinibacterium aquaticum TaxID=2613962 RepID=A0A5J5GN65_9RHOB|nr:alpha/beta fold hydrolase [Histidinibacterium aquaticum]KAA9009163.1 alpha/beta fold hydrolase [Histidinibacterium aquaticum]
MQTRRLTAAGIETHCLIAGPVEAPPVLLLHGGGLDRAALAWSETMRALQPTFRCYAPDLPGYGSSGGFAGPHDLGQLTDWALALMDELGVARAHVVGNSMGGGIALRLGLDHPERVDRLVPVGAYGLAPRYIGQPALWVLARFGSSRLVSATAARWELAARAALRWVYADPKQITPEVLAGLREEARRQLRRQSFRRFLMAEAAPTAFRSAMLDRLPQMERPTLLIHGTSDRIVPIRHARRAARLAPQIELYEMPVGHWPMRERPEIFLSKLRAFLTD